MSDNDKELSLILKGDKRHIAGSFRYEITDNGWRPIDEYNTKGSIKKEDSSVSPYTYLFFVENMVVQLFSKKDMVYYTELYRVLNSTAKNTGASGAAQGLIDKLKALDSSNSNKDNVFSFIESVEKELREFTKETVPDNKLDSRNFKRDKYINNDKLNVANIDMIDSVLARQKFKNIVNALDTNDTVSPRNKKLNGFGGIVVSLVRNTESTKYEIVSSESPVSKFTGNYIQRTKDVFYDRDTNLPEEEYSEVEELSFKYDVLSKKWSFFSIGHTRTAIKARLYAAGQVTSRDTVWGIDKLKPDYRKALESCIDMQN
jgi:hypothetical protein